MKIKEAMWIHGNAVCSEGFADGTLQRLEDIVVHPKGTGVELSLAPQSSPTSDNIYWFHFAIPTPVLIDHRRLRLNRVMILFDTLSTEGATDSGTIQRVILFDADREIQAFNGLHLQGKHARGLDQNNIFTLAQPVVVYFGLGVSIAFRFDITNRGILRITSVGADFSLP